jgi:ribosome maturation factor RimP
MEDKIIGLIEPTLTDLGYGLVKVSMRGGTAPVLEILIERIDRERIQVGDCKKVSRNVAAILDVEDQIAGKYLLEVSSAGAERPLVKQEDYVRFTGRDIKIRLKEQFNGKLNYKGKLLSIEDGIVLLKSKNVELKFQYSNIKSANLVLTDEMFRELLKGIKD